MHSGIILKNKFEACNFMEEYFQPGRESRVDEQRYVYVPRWAQALIDLYTSPLKYEVQEDIRKEKL